FIEETMSEPLQKALNGLSVDFRRTLILVDVQELSYEEVAGLMCCPVGTVRSRLHRAREALRKALQKPAGAEH
ncbi:MAG: sigma-70 family RNA polymerase sigma factor, partial [Armatimonadetes bacterium]|nr:sigma-70 family RNA polymerase sigma factor [Armatimonadota bacterium]